MSAFDTEPRYEDLRLIKRSLREGWPIPDRTFREIETFVTKARLAGRNDRITNLAAEVLQALEQAKAADRDREDHEVLEGMLATERQRDQAALADRPPSRGSTLLNSTTKPTNADKPHGAN